jgi:hypothetical protein
MFIMVILFPRHKSRESVKIGPHPWGQPLSQIILVPHFQRVAKVHNILKFSKEHKIIKLKLKRSTQQNKDKICPKKQLLLNKYQSPTPKIQ